MLVELAIGDAYGAGFEFADPSVVLAHNDPSNGYRPHPKGTIAPGKYTDDTQMTVGLVLYMTRKLTSTLDLADMFVQVFKRNPRQGYSQGFFDILRRVKNGTELLRAVDPMSVRSGGAMRAAPCGLLPDLEGAVDLAMWQASLTHATRDGMNAAGATAAMVWACRHDCELDYLPMLLSDLFPSYLWDKTPAAVPNLGYDVAQAVCYVLSQGGTMTDLLTRSVALTGDVDTVAALVMAAASLHPRVEQDLPQVLFDTLENGPFGRGYLQGLDKVLMDSFPLPVTPAQYFDPTEISPEETPELDPLSFLFDV